MNFMKKNIFIVALLANLIGVFGCAMGMEKKSSKEKGFTFSIQKRTEEIDSVFKLEVGVFQSVNTNEVDAKIKKLEQSNIKEPEKKEIIEYLVRAKAMLKWNGNEKAEAKSEESSRAKEPNRLVYSMNGTSEGDSFTGNDYVKKSVLVPLLKKIDDVLKKDNLKDITQSVEQKFKNHEEKAREWYRVLDDLDEVRKEMEKIEKKEKKDDGDPKKLEELKKKGAELEEKKLNLTPKTKEEEEDERKDQESKQQQDSTIKEYNDRLSTKIKKLCSNHKIGVATLGAVFVAAIAVTAIHFIAKINTTKMSEGRVRSLVEKVKTLDTNIKNNKTKYAVIGTAIVAGLVVADYAVTNKQV